MTRHERLDARKLIHDLGGPTELHRQLARKGYEITVKGIDGWVYRDSVPGKWQPVLLTMAKKGLAHYITTKPASEKGAAENDGGGFLE